MQNLQKYLPSKKFSTFVLFIIVLIIVFLVGKQTINFVKSNIQHKGQPIQLTVSGIIQKDSNNNGIADWEEYLWGLDPAKNGQKNKEFILEKKKSLENGGLISGSDENYITQNEMLSRQFFATIISLQQTGELNQETLDSISESIGEEIEASPIADIYTSKDLDITDDSDQANIKYYNDLKALMVKYEDNDIGEELTLISQALGSNDDQAFYAAKTIANSYKSFSSEIINIPVPRKLIPLHLNLANNYYKTGLSIDGLVLTKTDPILAMKSIMNYKKYSDALVETFENLSVILQ